MEELLRQIESPFFWLGLAALYLVVFIAGWIGKKVFNLPEVVGMTFGGMALSPTAAGAIMPDLYRQMFTPAVIDVALGAILAPLSALIFQGMTGLEFDMKHIRGKGKSAIMISMAGIVAPFIISWPLALVLHEYFAPDVRFLTFWLFVGASFSITSIVTAQFILKRSGMLHTPIGQSIIAAAALDDGLGWLIVAFILAIATGGGHANVWIEVGETLLFLVVMFTFGRWLLRHIMPRNPHSKIALGMTFGLFILVAALGRAIHVHPIFATFVLGACMPKGIVCTAHRRTVDGEEKVIVKEEEYCHVLIHRMEHVVEEFFLVFFLAASGVKTDVFGAGGWFWWFCCGLVTLVACATKFGACSVVARSTGYSWRESLGFGSLMNSRGLMGLMIVSVAAGAGCMTQPVYTMMVLASIFTTAIAAPLFYRCYARHSGVSVAPHWLTIIVDRAVSRVAERVGSRNGNRRT